MFKYRSDQRALVSSVASYANMTTATGASWIVAAAAGNGLKFQNVLRMVCQDLHHRPALHCLDVLWSERLFSESNKSTIFLSPEMWLAGERSKRPKVSAKKC